MGKLGLDLSQHIYYLLMVDSLLDAICILKINVRQIIKLSILWLSNLLDQAFQRFSSVNGYNVILTNM